MKEPLVSIIIIVKNGAQFIQEAIESVQLQTYRNTEILVVYSESQDNTQEILDKFQGKIRKIDQSGSGIADAYNIGIKQSCGELISFLSHDDTWDKEKLALQVAAFNDDSQLDYCITMIQHYLEAGATLREGYRASLLNEPVKGFIMESLMVKRKIYDAIGYYDPKFPVAEDTDWFSRCIDHGLSYYCVPKVMVRKRVHSTNAHLNQENVSNILLQSMHQSILRKRNMTS